MQIALIGINYKSAPLQLREQVAKGFLERFCIDSPITSYVLLSTCNRTELYFSCDDLVEAHQSLLWLLRQSISCDFDSCCYSFFGKDCFFHLAKVASGLDSAIFGETEIQGQVRTAYEEAKKNRPLSKELHFLFQKSLKIAKSIRVECQLEENKAHLEKIVLDIASAFFDKSLPTPLIIGCSHINLKIADFLHRNRVTPCFINRHDDKALSAASTYGGKALSWPQLKKEWHYYSWIIAATKSPSYVIDEEGECSKKRLLFDLSCPRNISPATAGTHYNIDDLSKLVIKDERTANILKQGELALLDRVNYHLSAFRKSYLFVWRPNRVG